MTANTWTTDPDTGVTWSGDGRFDILEGPDGYMLRENQGTDDSPDGIDSVDWAEVDTYDTLSEAQAAAGTDPPAYSPYSGDPDGYDRNGASDGRGHVYTDAEGGL